MSGTIELSETDRAYLTAASALRSSYPEAAKYLERLVWNKVSHEITADPASWSSNVEEWIKDHYRLLP